MYLSEQGENLIKQDFLQDDRSVGAHTDTHTERSNGAVLEQGREDGLIAVLQATIDTLQGQLEVKDRQIEQQAQTITRLSDALVVAQQTAAAAQALHAGTIQQQLLSGEVGTDQQHSEPELFMKKVLMTFVVMLIVIYIISLIGHNIFKSSEFSVLVSIAAASAVIVFFNNFDGDKK